MKTEDSRGWGLRVGGCEPYLAWGVFHCAKERVEEHKTQPYHRAVKVVMLPLAEYRRLKRLEKALNAKR